MVFSEELKTEQAKNIKINEPCIFPDNDYIYFLFTNMSKTNITIYV